MPDGPRRPSHHPRQRYAPVHTFSGAHPAPTYTSGLAIVRNALSQQRLAPIATRPPRHTLGARLSRRVPSPKPPPDSLLSYFSLTYTSLSTAHVPPERTHENAHRPQQRSSRQGQPLPSETHMISRFPRLGCLRMYRAFDSAASVAASPHSGRDDVAFSMSGRDPRAKMVMSEFNGFTCVSSYRCQPRAVRSTAHRSPDHALLDVNVRQAIRALARRSGERRPRNSD